MKKGRNEKMFCEGDLNICISLKKESNGLNLLKNKEVYQPLLGLFLNGLFYSKENQIKIDVWGTLYP